MKTKHTPGLWSIGKSGRIEAINGLGKTVIVDKLAIGDPANARLIAAAPSLLDALAELTSAASAVWEIIDGDRDKQEAWAKELRRIDVAAEAAKRLLQQVRYGEQ